MGEWDADQRCWHEWSREPAESGEFECRDCAQTRPACNTCGRINHASTLICPACVDRTQRLLAKAARVYWQIPDGQRVAIGLQAVRYDRGTPSTGLQISSDPGPDDPAELLQLRAANPSRHMIDLMTDPANLLEVLLDWADDFAGRRGVDWSGRLVFEFLAEHTIWAAQNHPAWDAYLLELRKVLGRFFTLAGLSSKRDPAPCPHCAGDVVQDWADDDGFAHIDGLQDEMRCLRCGITWESPAVFARVKSNIAGELPGTHPDALVTLEQATGAAKWSTLRDVLARDRREHERSKARIRKWDEAVVAAGDDPERLAELGPRPPLRSIRIPERGTDDRGRPLYRLGDLMPATARRYRNGQGMPSGSSAAV